MASVLLNADRDTPSFRAWNEPMVKTSFVEEFFSPQSKALTV